jgi:RNA polymerase sigma factor (sigma-70 family)
MEKYKISDKKLVSSYRNGNEEAFAELLRRHQTRIFSTIYLIVKDRYVAEDLLQETCIKAVNTIRAGRYNEEGKFLPWIVRIAHNLAIDYFRKTKRHPEVVLEDGSFVFNNMEFSEDSYESLRIKKETHARLRDFIKELPDNQREVLVMRHYMDMSFKEISDITGVSINTALGRMRYALINLRKKMNKQQNAYDQNFYPD